MECMKFNDISNKYDAILKNIIITKTVSPQENKTEKNNSNSS